MKILHLFSNWKWTGPAELAVNLAAMLARQHEVRFIPGSSPQPDIPSEVAARAADRGLKLVDQLYLKKHLNVRHNVFDVIRLRQLLAREQFDLVHTHLPNDHLVAGMACLAIRNSPPVVRSFYGAEGPESKRRTRLLLKKFTAGAIVISQAGRARLLEQYRFPKARCAWIPVGVDTKRFDPDRIDRVAARESLGLAPNDFAFGIVARMQRHRRFETLLEAMRQAMGKASGIKLVIVGRGTHREEVAIGPVEAMGLSDRILFPGYLEGEEYVQALAALDAAVFLVPGSDGSCRAVREKMAMGLPMIATNIPPLDEMITEDVTGYLVECTIDQIREAVLKMAGNRERTARMAGASRTYGRKVFSLERQVKTVEEFYASLTALA